MTSYRYATVGWGLLLLGLGACHKRAEEQPAPEPLTETVDWYILRSPEAREVVAVTGDLDGTLLFTTRFNVYRTTDRGQTWTTSVPSNFGIFGFLTRHDTIFTLTGGLGSIVDSTAAYATNPTDYSTDLGRSWQRYQHASGTILNAKVPLNRVRTPVGTTYRLGTERMPTAPNATSFYVTSKGINGPMGQVLGLPQTHQVRSLYLDSKARLYVAASAPMCGQGKDFTFCGEQNGVLYISKKPLP